MLKLPLMNTIVHEILCIILNNHCIVSDRAKYSTYHGLLYILVVWVPAYAHHHLMDISTSNAGPAIINAGGEIGRKAVYDLFREVS